MQFKATYAATNSKSLVIPFIVMPEARALLGGASDIPEQKMLSRSFSLITYWLLKLAERPAIEHAIE